MKIIIACDSFKGSLSADKVCNSIKDGILSVSPYSDVLCMPMADGGEGTVDCFFENCGGQMKSLTVNNIFFEQIDISYVVLPDKTAVIETAAASGITTIDKKRLNPIKASSYGTGEIIKAAVESGIKNIIIGLGGSATNDGGMGVLSALGINFIDEYNNKLLPVGENMIRVRSISTGEEFKKYSNIKFTLACDVENPYYGENGAAFVFAPQKGANNEVVKELDAGLRNLAEVFRAYSDTDLQSVKGTGAAGGIAGALMAMLKCEIRSGFSVLAEKTDFEAKIKYADLIITGEGRTDLQTAFGKLPKRVCEIARKNNVPCILLSGDIADDLKLEQMGFSKAYKIRSKDMTVDYAMENAAILLRNKAKEIIKNT